MFRHLFTGPDGESHVEDLTQSLTAEAPEPRQLKQAEGIFFSRREPGFSTGWQNVPRRQYVIGIAGAMEVTLGDGTKFSITPGDIVLAEDLTGHGHTARVVGDSLHVAALVPLRDQD